MSRNVPTPSPPPEGPLSPPPPEGPPPDPVAAENGQEQKPRRGRPKATPDEEKPFKPKVTTLHVNAVRKVRTGDYESFEVMMHLEAEPDPTRSVRQNLQMLGGLVVQEAGEIAERVGREIEISRG